MVLGLAACGASGSTAPAKRGPANEYADAWHNVARRSCTAPAETTPGVSSDLLLFKPDCGFSSYAISDEEPASTPNNYGISYDPGEDDTEHHGWEVFLRMAKAVGCESLAPTTRPTSSVEVRCEETG